MVEGNSLQVTVVPGPGRGLGRQCRWRNAPGSFVQLSIVDNVGAASPGSAPVCGA